MTRKIIIPLPDEVLNEAEKRLKEDTSTLTKKSARWAFQEHQKQSDSYSPKSVDLAYGGMTRSGMHDDFFANAYEQNFLFNEYFSSSYGPIKGNVLEKILAARSPEQKAAQTLKLRNLASWIKHPQLYWKDVAGEATSEDQEKLEASKESYQTEFTTDSGVSLEFDIVSRPSDNPDAIVLAEQKASITSGGADARTQVLVDSIEEFLNLIRDDDLHVNRRGKTISLKQFLDEEGIDEIRYYFGLYFDENGEPATLQGDKKRGRFSGSRNRFNAMNKNLEQWSDAENVTYDEDVLSIEFTWDGIRFTIDGVYGDDYVSKVFGVEDFTVNDLLEGVLSDDLWVTYQVANWEGGIYGQYGDNNALAIYREFQENPKVTEMYAELKEMYDTASLEDRDHAESVYHDFVEKMTEYLLNERRDQLYIEEVPQPNRYINDVVHVTLIWDALDQRITVDPQ